MTMAGLVAGALDPDQWAFTPRELSRALGDQLDDAIDVNAAGRLPWVERRWDGPVFLTPESLGRWIADWRAEVASRKML
jgi:hypothetical protein